MVIFVSFAMMESVRMLMRSDARSVAAKRILCVKLPKAPKERSR